MAQADSASNTSRRIFLVGAAAASAAVVVPMTVAAAPQAVDPEFKQLTDVAYATYDLRRQARLVLIDIQKKADAWFQQNPEPLYDDGKERAHSGHYGTVYSAWMNARHAYWVEIGLAKAKSDFSEAESNYDNAVYQVSQFSPSNWTELYAKADFARDIDNSTNDVAASVMYDIFQLNNPRS